MENITMTVIIYFLMIDNESTETETEPTTSIRTTTGVTSTVSGATGSLVTNPGTAKTTGTVATNGQIGTRSSTKESIAPQQTKLTSTSTSLLTSQLPSPTCCPCTTP